MGGPLCHHKSKRAWGEFHGCIVDSVSNAPPATDTESLAHVVHVVDGSGIAKEDSRAVFVRLDCPNGCKEP